MKKTIEENNVCASCKESITDEFIPKCYCPECGSEWQSEQMYSEEEVNELLKKFKTDSKFHPDFNVTQWFNQFKKK